MVSNNKWSFTWWNFPLSSGIAITIIESLRTFSTGTCASLRQVGWFWGRGCGAVGLVCGAGPAALAPTCLWCSTTAGEPLDFSLYSFLPPLTCPDVLDWNLSRAKAVFYHVAVKCQSLLVNLSTPVVGMIIPIIKAKPGHLAAIMVMSCSVTVGHSVQLLLRLILYWKRPLFSFRLCLCGLKIEKACSSATCPRYRGWKEAHNPQSIIHGGMIWYSATVKSLVPPQSKWWSLLPSNRLLRWLHPSLPGAQITCSVPRGCEHSCFHSNIMAGLWLDSKPLHLPVASCSGSCNVSQHGRALGCSPCPSHCCWWIAALLVCLYTADSPVLWDWDITRAESHKVKQNIN